MNDTSPEIEKMQFEMMMNLGAKRRIALASEMFMAARKLIFASLPKDLSEREIKKRYYEKMYGEPLPADFFKTKKMIIKKVVSLMFSILLVVSLAKAQTAEVAVSLNEQFFDTLLDAMFKNFNAPEFPIAVMQEREKGRKGKREKGSYVNIGFENEGRRTTDEGRVCNESIKLLREIDGVRTAVRFREGKIYAPIAFSGAYNPPLIGCVEFSGWAETTIDLEYARNSQKLIGKVRVLNVSLGGTGGIGGGLLAKLVQSSIDKKINPIEILQTDKLSFVVPVQNAGGALRMKAVAVRHEIANGVLNVYIAYEFVKA